MDHSFCNRSLHPPGEGSSSTKESEKKQHFRSLSWLSEKYGVAASTNVTSSELTGIIFPLKMFFWEEEKNVPKKGSDDFWWAFFFFSRPTVAYHINRDQRGGPPPNLIRD